MTLESRLGRSPSAERIAEADLIDVLAAEAIEFVDVTEFSFHFGPARGILNAVAMGTGAWTIILAAVALSRTLLFG